MGMVALSNRLLTEKVLAGERISAAEALELYRLPLETLGALANARRDLAKGGSYDERGREKGSAHCESDLRFRDYSFPVSTGHRAAAHVSSSLARTRTRER